MTKLPGTTVRNFIRGPAWVYYRVPPSKHLGRDTEDMNPEYLEEEKERFRDPVQHREYRKGMINRVNKAFRLVIVLVLRLVKKLTEYSSSKARTTKRL